MGGIGRLNRSLGWSRLFLLVLLTGILAPTLAVAEPALLKGSKPITVDPYFSCVIPADWSEGNSYAGSALSPEEKKVFGVEFSKYSWGPVPMRISVHYYAEGNLLHSTPELYIARKAHPVVEQAGKYRYGELFDTVVDGRPAKTFMRPYYQFVSAEPLLPGSSQDDPKDDARVYEGREMMARKEPLVERYVVVPADSGFYALVYSAPDDHFEEFLGVFDGLLDTFNPLR
ncbi:MAG: hypothetical protein R2940_15250 [Syntrophotaleaceae bacterium]